MPFIIIILSVAVLKEQKRNLENMIGLLVPISVSVDLARLVHGQIVPVVEAIIVDVVRECYICFWSYKTTMHTAYRQAETHKTRVQYFIYCVTPQH